MKSAGQILEYLKSLNVHFHHNGNHNPKFIIMEITYSDNIPNNMS